MGNKGQRGGAQPGAGRKRKVDEEWARKVCIDAVVKKYGSLEEGIQQVLSGQDEKIKLLVWTHILGQPEQAQKVKLSNSKGGELKDGVLNAKSIVVEVVRTVHNNTVNPDGTVSNENNHSS